MHRDLKLQNVMIHFADIKNDICTDPNFVLNDYIAKYDFRKNSLTCKIADLGFARKLKED